MTEMRTFLRRVIKKSFSVPGKKMRVSERRFKLLYFDRVPLPNHLTYSELKVVNGKLLPISFIWYTGI